MPSKGRPLRIALLAHEFLISSAQRIEHYEIAAYGVARTFAEKLDQIAAADLLQETLNEEGMTDQHLTRLALRKINAEAVAV